MEQLARRLPETVCLRQRGAPPFDQFGVAFDNAAIGMALVGLDGRFLRVNQALCELVGYDEPELLAMAWQSITHPDDVEAGEHEVEKTLASADRTFHLPKRYIRRDGATVSVLLNVSLIRADDGEPTCLFTQVTDISERQEAEESRARLAAIVEASDDAIVRKSLDGTVLSWNRGAERMYGYTATETVGRNIRMVVPDDRRIELEYLLRRVGSGEPVRNYETVRLRKDGSTVEVALTLSPIFNSDRRVIGVSSVARDISEQKRLVRELAAALGEAQAAEARTRQFLSDAAHHLRTPITGIRSCAETFLRGCRPQEQERLLAEVVRQASRASVVIAQLLTIARLDRGDDLATENSDLLEVCREEVARSRGFAPWVEIVLAYDASAPVDVDGNASRQILATLLDNAIRHAMSRIDVAVVNGDGTVEVRVVDNGPGLSAALGERAFEPFVTLDGKGGSGLGLPLARALARARAGDLSYEDGAFVLRLPTSA